MQVDEIGAIPQWIPPQWMFSTNDATLLVIHKSGGGSSAQGVAAWFLSGAGGAHTSSHYIIGQDGTIVQCVPEDRGAGANCCAESGHASYIPETWNGITDNANLHSISVEHVDPALDNSTPLTDAQKRASFTLIKHICTRHNIPPRSPIKDGRGGICGHNAIEPLTRGHCPGNYPWSELWSFLQMDFTNRDKQAAAIWNSTQQLLMKSYGSPANFNSSIAGGWKELVHRGLKPGAPLTLEYATIDWGGTPIVCQEFSGGVHAEWTNGTAKFYDVYGQEL